MKNKKIAAEIKTVAKNIQDWVLTPATIHIPMPKAYMHVLETQIERLNKIAKKIKRQDKRK